MEFRPGTVPTIACCNCGVAIEANPSNMCVNCIRTRVDITEGIPKQVAVHWCKYCTRYLVPPKSWTKAELESKELLAIVLKRIRGLNKVKLIDAAWVWTEPHSMRLKVKLTIQKEVFAATILQQVFLVDITVELLQCNNCKAVMSEDSWNAVVQVRQKVNHKRTFMLLEQLILKYNAQQHCINIKEETNGLDFYYTTKSHALQFMDFVSSVVPIKTKASERLISADTHSNTYNYKFSFLCDIAPICKDDLVCLPPNITAKISNNAPIVLCHRVSQLMSFINPSTLTTGDLASNVFWKQPFRSVGTPKQLTEFVLLDIEPTGVTHGKFVLADCQVARACDIGSNDLVRHTRTHLGHVLKPGDNVLGYDLTTMNFNEADFAGHRNLNTVDIILVKKHYPQREKKRRFRQWKLRTIDKEAMDTARPADEQRLEHDYEEFLQELEEDPELRSRINIYKDPNAPVKAADAQSEMDDEEETGPSVGVDELLEGLALDDDDDDDDDEGEDAGDDMDC